MNDLQAEIVLLKNSVMLKQFVFVLQVLPSSWSTPVTRSYMGYPYSPTIPPRFYRSYLVYNHVIVLQVLPSSWSTPVNTELHGISLQPHDTTQVLPLISRIYVIVLQVLHSSWSTPVTQSYMGYPYSPTIQPRFYRSYLVYVLVLQVLPSSWSTPVTQSYMGYPYSRTIQPRFYCSYLVLCCIYVIVLQVLLSSWSTPVTQSYMGYPYSRTIQPRFCRSYLVYNHVIVLQVLPSSWSTPVTRSYMGYPYSPTIQPRFYRSYLVYMSLYCRYYPVPDLHQWHGATWDIPTAPRYNPGSTTHISYICPCTTGITQFLIYTSDTELHGISLQPHDTTQVLPLISRIYVIVLQVLPSSWSTPVTQSYMGYPYSPTIPPRFYRSYLVYMSLYYRYYSVPDLHKWHGATWDISTAPRYHPGSTTHISYICHCTTGITQFLIYTSDTELHGISLQPHDTTQVLPLISRIYICHCTTGITTVPDLHEWHGATWDIPTAPWYNPGSIAHISYIIMSLYCRYYTVPDLHEWHGATWDIPTAPWYHSSSAAHISYICHCTTGITQFLIYTSDTELHGISLQPHDTTQVLPLISRI